MNLSQYFGLWSIEPHRGQGIAQSLRGMDWTAHFAAAEERRKAETLDGQYRPVKAEGGVAQINVSGVMTKGGSSLSESGSTIRIRQQLRSAVKDERVSSILLVIDSPGGTVDGTADLAAEVARANKQKPVIAFVEDVCASAAYWVASQASEVHANADTAMIGSIGTYMVVRDLSKAFEKEGITTHVIATGAFKGAGAMGAEVTEEQIENWQSLVDKSQKSFSAAVKAGRKLTDEQLESLADGRVWVAPDALKHGLIDAISSFDDVLARAASAGKKKGRTMSAEKDDAPRGASLAELKSIGASSEFVIQQLEKGATLADAKSSWLDQRLAALEQREEALTAKEEAVAKREKAVEDKENKPSHSGKGGLKVVRDPDASDEVAGGGSAQEQMEAIVAAKVKAGIPKAKAWSDAVRENKELHQRSLEEAPRVEQRRA